MFNLQARPSPLSRKAVSVTFWILLVANFFGYLGFRYYLHDLTGGDVVNLAQQGETYTLPSRNIGYSREFYTLLSSGKSDASINNPATFIYRNISAKGQQSLDRLAKGSTDEGDEAIFTQELNVSFLEKNVDWPNPFLTGVPEAYNKTSSGENERGKYNLLVLSQLYPKHITPPRPKTSFGALLKTAPSVIYDYFNDPTRYTVVANSYTVLAQRYIHDKPENGLWALSVITGVVYSLIMGIYFLLAFKFIQSISWALFSLLLYQATPAMMKSSFSLYSPLYIFVPFVMLVSLFGYLKFKETGKWMWLALFTFTSIIGPWIREFACAIPYIVFASEILATQGKRSARLVVLCPSLMIHSIYPSLVPWLLGINKAGVTSVFFTSVASVNMTMQSWPHWHIFGLLFAQIAPSLWVLLVVSLGCWFWRSRLYEDGEAVAGISLNSHSSRKLDWGIRMGALVMLIALVATFCHAFFISNKTTEQATNSIGELPLFLLIAFIGLVSFRFNKFLSLYFFAVSIPFVRVFLMDNHFAFTLPPLAILLSLWIRDLFISVCDNFTSWKRQLSLALLSLLFVVGLLDQVLNIPASALTQEKLISSNKEIADWFKAHVPRHSIVVGNFFNLAEIFYYSGMHFDAYDANEYHYFNKWIPNNQGLGKLIERNIGARDIYLISSNHDYYSWQATWHSHRFVGSPTLKKEKIASFSVQQVYHYIDPIKYLAPRIFVPLVSYQDWESDYYFNNLPELFRRIQKADYEVFKVLGLDGDKDGEMRDPLAGTVPHLVRTISNYNIVEFNGLYYGIPHSVPVEWGNADVSKIPGIIVNRSFLTLEKQISRKPNQQGNK